MSTGVLAAIIVVAVIVVAGLVAAALSASRRRRLQQRFGPEYDRVVGEQQSQRKADAELADRERRVQSLNLRPLDDASRAEYASRWAITQEQFVDRPQEAVTHAQLLVTAVMREIGYPTEDDGQIEADLSVQHANTLQHYRTAQAISEIAAVGNASTEDLRQAMIQYRVLFSDLLGDQPGEEPEVPSQQPASQQPASRQAASQQPGSRQAASQQTLSDADSQVAPGAGAGEDWAGELSDQPARRTRRS